jgi:glycosyltransferase involved in cell wall biosynthesis
VKIGLTGSFRSHLDSLKYSFTFIEEALGAGHELLYLPQEYSRVARERQEELLREWLPVPDVLVGLIDPFLVQIRNSMARRPPYIALLLGTMPRGAPNLRNSWKHFTSADPLICNCLADQELTHSFFPNARTRMMPLAFDESLFYPLDSADKNDIRARMGFEQHDKILLYAGRMTLEKNVHTVLRVFSVVERALPNAHLIVAGNAEDAPFYEFGVSTPSIQRTLLRMAEKLGIPAGKIHHVGHKSGACGSFTTLPICTST